MVGSRKLFVFNDLTHIVTLSSYFSYHLVGKRTLYKDPAIYLSPLKSTHYRFGTGVALYSCCGDGPR
jgi:hypothetical protein